MKNFFFLFFFIFICILLISKINFCNYDLFAKSPLSFILECKKKNYVYLAGKQWIRSIPHKILYSDFNKNLRYSELAAKELIECGKNKKIILLIGQSNAANNVMSYNYINNKSLNLYNNNCYLLSNPVLGTTGTKDNISVAISHYLKNDNYIFLTAAWSGSSILDWGSNKYSYLSNYVNKQLQFYDRKFNIDFIIWLQGETDMKLYDNLDIDQGPTFFQEKGREYYYVEAFKEMLKNFKPFLNKKTKIILTTTSICRSKRSENINNQQKLIAKLSDNYFIIENTDNLGKNFRYDECHLNEKGVDITARSIAQVINSIE